MLRKESGLQPEHMMTQQFFEKLNNIRKEAGFLTLEEVLQLQQKDNILLDPFSLLISREVAIGSDNTFYPNVILQTQENGDITIGNKNLFFPNTFLLAEEGTIIIGNENQFGDGGCSIKANGENAQIIIENDGRYINNPLIIGNSYLGSGSQVIGNITVQNCKLAGGGNYQSSNPDERGAVLKGAGLARNIILERGHVINAYGIFQEAPIEQQSKYHPKK